MGGLQLLKDSGTVSKVGKKKKLKKIRERGQVKKNDFKGSLEV